MIWGLAFILGLQCGIEGAYFSRSTGAPAYSGVFSAWCDLREIMPYAFGYMMSAKVGTGLVAEIGAMRISDEIDALEVMGINSLMFLCSTRLLAAWLVLPFMYIAAVGAGFFASYLAVVQQIGEVSSGGFFLIFWMFQNPPDLFYSLIKGMAMATVIVLVGCYYGYTASGGPVGVGTATAKSMVLNTVMVHLVGNGGHADLLGLEPEGTDWRLAPSPSRFAPAAPRTSPDERAARRTLLEQVRRLEEELGRPLRLGVAAQGPRPASFPAQSAGGPRLLTLGELETLRDDLVEHLRRGRALLAERASAEEQSRRLIEEMLLDPASHRWAHVSSEDIGEPGCRHWHVRPRAGVLGMLMRWWRVVVSSGCP